MILKFKCKMFTEKWILGATRWGVRKQGWREGEVNFDFLVRRASRDLTESPGTRVALWRCPNLRQDGGLEIPEEASPCTQSVCP